MLNTEYDVIVLGAGADGLMCAAAVGQRGRKVLLIEHADEPGKQILLSGGGRWQFPNLHTAPDRYLSPNPHFANSACSRVTTKYVLGMYDRNELAWSEKN